MDMPVKPVLVAVADPSDAAREWFEQQIDGLEYCGPSHVEMLAAAKLDVVYVAVPHQLHEKLYLDVLESGADLLAEKPFGIDRGAAERIAVAAESHGAFVRCSSEFPFMPGAQRAYEHVRDGNLGRILEVVSGFHHSSDLDSSKTANWKRQSATCGEIGVLGDLGMHVFHLPLRLGWRPNRVFAQLQKGFGQRPDGMGGMTTCDTWDNATVHTWQGSGEDSFPLRFEMKRLVPGETNTWFFEAVGTQGGVRFSTARPKTIEFFDPGKEQAWRSVDLGFGVPFKTITGGIFEVGFPDVIQQMWAAYLTEREGLLEGRFGCVTPQEAVLAQHYYQAALDSQAGSKVVKMQL